MNNDKKNNLGHEALILIGCIMLLSFICRLWPILLLMLLAVFAAAIILLLRPQTGTNDTLSETPPAKTDVKLPNEKDVQALAYSVILRRITELVTTSYPEARWVWEAPNARQLIELGEDVFILLNRAGGYRRAHVVIQNLQVVTIEYNCAPTKPIASDDDDTDTNEPVAENFDLVAFEWADAHIIELNKRCNEAIGEGMTEIILTSDELPVKESWPAICKELEKNGLDDVKCIPQGIKINLTQ